MTIYTDFQIASKLDLVNKADALVAEDVANKVAHDEGTCVLGAGIAVWYKAPRKRTVTRKILVRAPFQGNVGSYHACARALAYLKEQGFDCFWYDGVMD